MGSQLPRLRVADGRRFDATLGSMAGRIVSLVEGLTGLVGLRRRGVPVAERLATELAEMGVRVPVGELVLKRYDDELNVLHDEPALEQVPLPFDVAGARVVVVDDVLYTGRTLLRASNHFLDRGARLVMCAVVSSRGRPEVPVEVACVGVRLDVPDELAVEVHVPPYEGERGVWIRRKEV